MKWQTQTILYAKIAHKILAYLMIILGFVAIYTGIKIYRVWNSIEFELEYLHLVLTIVIFGLMELTWRLT